MSSSAVGVWVSAVGVWVSAVGVWVGGCGVRFSTFRERALALARSR